MKRELKFRAWDEDDENYIYWGVGEEIPYRNDMELPYVKSVVEQYTGLKDKQGLTEVYEGDIIDNNGLVRGNIHEMDARAIDIVIPSITGESWTSTIKKGMERGLQYP